MIFGVLAFLSSKSSAIVDSEQYGSGIFASDDSVYFEIEHSAERYEGARYLLNNAAPELKNYIGVTLS